MPESHSPSTHPVSLPSIHEMFPAHLLRPEDEYDNRHKYPKYYQNRSPPRLLAQILPYSHRSAHDPRLRDSGARPPHVDSRKRPASSHVYSLDALRSDPINSPLQHLTSSSSTPNHTSNSQQHLCSNAVASSSPAFRVSAPPTTAANVLSIEGRSRAPQPIDPVPTIISFPVSESRSPESVSESSKHSQSPSEDSSDDDNPGESAGKKHICPTCLKRFNRPSSLRIHVNTHTGATPFRCPWPDCGRAFNVNSNMRRHYRNHTTPGLSRAQPTDAGRKRRGVDTLNALSYPPESMSRVVVASTKPQHASPPYSTTSRYHQRQQYPLSSSPRSDSSSPPPHLASIPSSATLTKHSYPLVHTKREHKYSPSTPYMHSLADSRVSTALRPAFHL